MLAGVAGVLCLLGAGSDNPQYASDAFKHASHISNNWVELLTGMLLWKYPTLQPQLHLRTLLTTVKRSVSVSRHTDDEFLDFFDQVGCAI
jgi:hypothetical protein